MMNSIGLGMVFTAKDLASGTIQNLNGHFKEMQKSGGAAGVAAGAGLMSFKTGLVAASAGAAGLGLALKAANTFTDFEFHLTGVGAVMQATTEQMQMLKDAAIEAGVKTEFSPTQAVEGLQALAQAGQSATQATKSLIPVLDLAGASFGQVGVGGAAASVVGVLNSYSFSADKASEVTDKLVKITQMSNFQIRDFEGGLATAGASAGMFNQSLDDTLVLMGLLRNRNIETSTAATALRESFRRLGSDQSAQKAIMGQGVKIFDDTTGKMRSVVDITEDLIEATKGMTDQQRNRIVVEGFGARGLATFAAIEKASFTERKNGVDVIKKGSEAIQGMRESLDHATGSAETFRAKMLDTFKGQQILLHGSMETLAIVTGEAFAKAFKPIIGGTIDAVNGLIHAFQRTPEPVRNFVTWLVVGGSALLSIIGTAQIVSAGLGLLGLSMGGIIIEAGLVVLSMAPIVAVLGLLAATVVAVRQGVDENVGGIGDTFRSVFHDVRLFYDGLVQLFSQGGFTGAVRDEFRKAENQGIQNFAIRVWAIFTRLQNFAENAWATFHQAISDAGPTFQALGDAFHRIGVALGFVTDDIDHAAAKDAFGAWGERGKQAGELLAKAVEGVVKIVTIALNVTAGLISTWGQLDAVLSDSGVFSAVGELLRNIAEDLGLMEAGTDGAGSSWAAFGGLLGGAIVSAIRTALGVVEGLVFVVQDLWNILAGVGKFVFFVFAGQWGEAWKAMKQVVFGVVAGIVDVFLHLVRVVAGALDTIASFAGKDLGLQKVVADFQRGAREDFAKDMGVASPSPAAPGGGQPFTPQTSPTVANASQSASFDPALLGNISAALMSGQNASQPMVAHVVLQLDNKTIAEEQASFQRTEKDRSGLNMSGPE